MLRHIAIPTIFVCVAALLWLADTAVRSPRAEEKETVSLNARTVSAPEFPEGLEWLNTRQPLTLRQLRGKVVLLDFWTYCCINCMHIIPDLKRLEKKYPRELVVIGVHSAKFTTERETENIRQAILRYEIEHPVVNDRDFEIWQAYNAQAWPTVVLIDPAGKIVAHHSGEGIFQPFDELIAQVIADFNARGLLNREPLHFDLERTLVREGPLSFPGKVLADEASHRLFISDSNHDRIVVASLDDARVLDVIGSGDNGLQDGNFQQASFNHPQGLALSGDSLYIADTENHAIRRADLTSRQVVRIAGTGRQADFPAYGGSGTNADLSSPWDLVIVEQNLYIAMAGTHQIWVMNLKSRVVQPYAGSGREGRIDGPLMQAALAQPSGITTDGRRLFFADSEVSSIRWADLPPGNQVGTIVGLDLFEFGDHDGRGDQVRLQHPLGVVFSHGLLYVADTYNNKIKVINPQDRTAKTLFGTGKAGAEDGKAATFDEPGGLSFAGGKLYIADTNNHQIRVADLQTGQVSTLALQGLEKLATRRERSKQAPPPIRLSQQTVKPGAVTINVSLQLPEGFKLTEQAPSRISLVANNQNVLLSDSSASLQLNGAEIPLRIPAVARAGSTEILAEMSVYYCRSVGESLCYFKDVRLILPLEIQRGAPSATADIHYKLE